MVSSRATTTSAPHRQHGVKGVFYGGDWLEDVEDLDRIWQNPPNCADCQRHGECSRSASTTTAASTNSGIYDVVLIGAGCIGAAVARQLSKYQLNILWLEASDDVSQGATKGNSGIVHAGYDDKPGTNRAKYCWPGNQMFSQLDRELRFGYQRNGSLVLAKEGQQSILQDLWDRGQTNGVKNLRILSQSEVRAMEPHVAPDVVAALHAPDAGNVIPYEYAIALAEHAVHHGVQLWTRRVVTDIKPANDNKDDGSNDLLQIHMDHWEPEQYIQAVTKSDGSRVLWSGLGLLGSLVVAYLAQSYYDAYGADVDDLPELGSAVLLGVAALLSLAVTLLPAALGEKVARGTIAEILKGKTVELQGGSAGSTQQDKTISVDDMLLGGSGSQNGMRGRVVESQTVKTRFVINCAGGYSDKIAKMVGDSSFYIKPRLGDYLLLNRNQGHLTTRTLFPCPDPVLGKGVLVQTTLWGNLILGPTARDVSNPDHRDLTPHQVQEYILQQCRALIPSFDPREVFHGFCGARAKSSRGDWIIEACATEPRMIHVAGIDSPGLAGSPAIALEVVRLLRGAGLRTPKNPNFNPNRAPIITPKNGMRGLKMGPIGKNDGTDEATMAANVICKCEKVTELEIVRACRRNIPVDSTQSMRKRTRAGMGHCQADESNYHCEARVKAIMGRELGVPLSHIGGRPWPATTTLPERWISDQEKEDMANRMVG